MAGDLYLRVKLGLPNSDGARILERRLGVERAWSFAVSMWDWFVEKHPTGEVVGPDADYLIARGSGWSGEPDAFCAAMVAAEYLAPVPEGFRVRGWREWAGFHLQKQARDAERKRKSRGPSTGGHADVTRTPDGQAQENGGSDRPCHADPSPISSIKSSEGVQGEGPRRVRLASPFPSGQDPHPLTTAVLAALWDRGIDAAPPSGKSAPRVEAAIRDAGVEQATERLAAILSDPDAKRPLTYHVGSLMAEAPRSPALPGPPVEWFSSLPPDDRERAESRWAATVERVKHAAYPDALPRLLAAEAQAFVEAWET